MFRFLRKSAYQIYLFTQLLIFQFTVKFVENVDFIGGCKLAHSSTVHFLQRKYNGYVTFSVGINCT